MITFETVLSGDRYQLMRCFPNKVGDTFINEAGTMVYIVLRSSYVAAFTLVTGDIDLLTVATVGHKVKPVNLRVKIEV